MSHHDDDRLTSLFAPVRELAPTDAEAAAVVRRAMAHPPRARTRRRGRPQRPTLALATAAVAVVLGLGYATAPPLRAAVDGVAGTFAGWTRDDTDAAPGRPATDDDKTPDYMRDGGITRDPRVIAEAGGYALFAALARDGTVEFDLGNTGVGMGGYTPASFDKTPVMVLGPGAMRRADSNGYVPLFGVTAKTVHSVELTYETGPPSRQDGIDGGFVLLAEPARQPIAVVARDEAGGQIVRVLVDNSKHPCPCIDWSQYAR